MTKKHVHLVYSIVLSITLVVSGICLIAACVGIYLSGDRPFSPEAVAAAFRHIALPVYLCLALVIGGWILNGAFPADTKKQPVQKQYQTILSRLHSKLALDSCDPALRTQILKQQKSRRLHKTIGLGLLVMGSIVFLCYGANGANFDQQDITGSMVKAMYWFFPCLAVPFGYAVFTAYYARASLQREIALVKQAIAAGAEAPAAQKQQKDHSKLLSGLRWALLGLAIAIAVYGFFAGGTNDVLTKAINICTECVGLG